MIVIRSQNSAMPLLTMLLGLLLTTAPLWSQSAEPLKKVVPLNLNATTGDITVGSTTYPASARPGLHMVALKRQPNSSRLDSPDLIANQTFTDGGAANAFLQSTLSATPDALLIVNGVGNYGFFLSAIANNLHSFGAAHDIDTINSAIPIIFIGSGGMNSGSARQRGNSALDFSGYLAADSNGNYTLIQTDYIRYDIELDGSIKIGSTDYTIASSYKTPACNGENAFHLVVVNRETPTVSVANNTYCTSASDAEISKLTADLGGVRERQDQLAFFASNGHPIPANRNFGANGDGRLSTFAKQIAQLGGLWETIMYMGPADTYSLVGTAAPPAGTPGANKRARESSSVYPDKPSGELHGVLARGRGNWYSPLTADPSGFANLSFYGILAQTPVPFPHPITAAELTAFQNISKELCGGTPCNVRDQYPNGNVSINAYLTVLESMKTDPNGNDCTVSTNASLPYCVVRTQLLGEFQKVIDIRAFNTNLQTLWLGSGTTSILELLSTYNDINANLPAPPPTPAPSLVNPIVNFLLGLGSYIPDIGPLFGIADTAFNFGISLTTDPQGNASIDLSTTVGQLEQQAAQQFTAQATTTGTQFDFIYQDWGKINTLGTNLAQAQAGSPWYWDSSTTGRILTGMAPAVEQSYYQSLMSALYAIGGYLPICYSCPGPVNWGGTPLWQQPYAYTVDDPDGPAPPGQSDKVEPFSFPTFPPYTFPGDATNPVQQPGNSDYREGTATIMADSQWLAISSKNSPSDSGGNGIYQPPAASILTHLFTPRSQGGLGVYRPAFYEKWPFARVTCGYSDDGYGDPGPGCNWGSAAPAIEATPSTVTSVTIQPEKIAKSGNQLSFALRVTNNGTTATDIAEITEITVRAIGGSGAVTLIEPALPVTTERLMPGASQVVGVRLNISGVVPKIVIVENGVVNSPSSTTHRFTHSQVLYPSAIK